MRTYDDFIEWLRNEGVLNTFFFNYQNHRVGRVRSVEDLFSRKQNNAILCAFSWHPTSEGFDFWSDMDTMFRRWYNI